jgi:hypothetical protein
MFFQGITPVRAGSHHVGDRIQEVADRSDGRAGSRSVCLVIFVRTGAPFAATRGQPGITRAQISASPSRPGAVILCVDVQKYQYWNPADTTLTNVRVS